MATGGSYTQVANASERNQEATVFVGGLDEKVTDELLWELMIQAGPVKHVYIPRDRITRQAQGYGFCEFRGEDDAQYAVKILNMVKLFGKPIKVQPSSEHKKNMDVGANIFIGNLDPDADEKLLYDTFSAFGLIIETPHIMRDPETGNSKGYGFVKFNSFDSSDTAIEAMNGGFIMNRSIVVQYAYKKDGHGKERHGSEAERLLASKAQDTTQQASRTSTDPARTMPLNSGINGGIHLMPTVPPGGPSGIPPGPPPQGYGGFGAPPGGPEGGPPPDRIPSYGMPNGSMPPSGPSGPPPMHGMGGHQMSGPSGPPPGQPGAGGPHPGMDGMGMHRMPPPPDRMMHVRGQGPPAQPVHGMPPPNMPPPHMANRGAPGMPMGGRGRGPPPPPPQYHQPYGMSGPPPPNRMPPPPSMHPPPPRPPAESQKES